MALRIGIVAAEPSGDLLGSRLIAAILRQAPDARFEGIAGPQMQAVGAVSWYPMERLSVMGLVEVLNHLPELLRIRRDLRRRWLSEPPDLFIGVDAPDFNLGLERKLKQAGIPTVHYVCPTVWAWREGRVKTLRRSVDLILSIFPFEVPFLARHQLGACYVGHPLANEIPFEIDQSGARAELGFDARAPVLALLPGSRRSEVSVLADDFILAAKQLHEHQPNLRCVAPMVSPGIRDYFERRLAALAPKLPVQLLDGQPRLALAAADVVLTASGTATFEALLHKRPMVVGYRLHPLTYWLAKGLKLVRAKYVAMANLLADEMLAPEFLQQQCKPKVLADALQALFDDPARRARIAARYRELHQQLRIEDADVAANAVLALIGEKSGAR